MKKFLKNLMKKFESNNRGSALTTSIVVMIVITLSVTAITNITINQLRSTSIKLDIVNEENIAKRLIQQAIGEFEVYPGDFDTYEASEISNVLSTYGIVVTNVSSQFGSTQSGVARVYKFSYTLDSGTILSMYSFASPSGSTADDFEPYSFSMATNGTLMLNGGYIENASLFGDDIHFGYVSPYIQRTNGGATLTPALTPEGSDAYPDFDGAGEHANVIFNSSYTYCGSTCFTVGPTISDEFVMEESEFIDITTSALETGVISDRNVVGDFFGSFDYDSHLISYVRTDGPTDFDVITDVMTYATIGSVVLANSGPPVDIGGGAYDPSTEPYTDVTLHVPFSPSTEAEVLDFGAVYDGNLIINEDFTMQGLNSETFVVNGDLDFQNTTDITVSGMIVVLGDLTFSGQSVAIEGGFYVTGETVVEFEWGYGFEDAGAMAQWGFSLIARDNVIVESLWESHTSSALPNQWDWYIYTEESIYIDAVNSRLNIRGVFFAAARENSANQIFIEDESALRVNGIFINSYRGRIRNNGSALPSNNVLRNSFYLSIVNQSELSTTFAELITFDDLVLTTYYVRSGFIYE